MMVLLLLVLFFAAKPVLCQKSEASVLGSWSTPPAQVPKEISSRRCANTYREPDHPY